MKAAVVQFPGSNCDRDMAVALRDVTGADVTMAWHKDTDFAVQPDIIAVPGGFSYGDYLRSGAMAARSPIMQAVVAAANRGVPVLGVCNGFQILTEAGLLPGALMRNSGIHFICTNAKLTIEATNTPFLRGYGAGEAVHFPVAHHDGNYFADDATLDRLEGEEQVALRYAVPINGSARNIAGVTNAAGNVLGMMPHPERAIDPIHNGTDGRRLFEALIGSLVG